MNTSDYEQECQSLYTEYYDIDFSLLPMTKEHDGISTYFYETLLFLEDPFMPSKEIWLTFDDDTVPVCIWCDDEWNYLVSNVVKESIIMIYEICVHEHKCLQKEKIINSKVCLSDTQHFITNVPPSIEVPKINENIKKDDDKDGIKNSEKEKSLWWKKIINKILPYLIIC